MVNTVIFLLIILLSTPALAAELTVRLNKTQVEMGKYLFTSIEYTGSHVPAKADLRQWQKDFVIDRLDTEIENLEDGQILSKEKLRLYPKQAGKYLLRSIALGGSTSMPVNIQVIPTMRKGINGTPHWLTVPTQLWQGQSIIVEIQIALLQASNHIAVEEALFKGFNVEKLARTSIIKNGIESIILRWKITALQPGKHILQTPAIEQRGRGRWRYYLRSKTLQVLPIPAYIPPGIPVGKVAINSQLIANNKAQWLLTITNKGQLPDEIYGLRTQIKNITENDELSFISTASKDSLLSKNSYRLSVANWSWGLGSGTVISIQYFDTDTGKLQTATTTLAPLWNIPPVFRYLLIVILLLIALAIIYALVKFSHSFQQQKRFRQSLVQSSSGHELRRQLLQHEKVKSLKEWASLKADDRENDIAEQLNQLCFSTASNAQLNELKKSVLKCYRYF